jgi:hypothetical protein
MRPSQILRVFIFGSGMALYVALAAWSYTAAIADDIVTAAVTISLAWLVSVCALALSEVFGALAGTRKLYWNICFGIGMAAISGLLFFYFYQHRPAPPYVEGARLVVLAGHPTKTDTGNFYFPVTVQDVGDRPVDSYVLGFSQESYSSELDIQGENAFMKQSEEIAEQRLDGLNLNSGTGSDITTKTGRSLINREAEVTPQQIEAMKNGTFFLYNGITVIFSDENSKRDSVLYYAQSCMWYDRHSQAFNSCRTHVVTKAIYLPFKSDPARSAPFPLPQEKPKKSELTSWLGQVCLRYWPLIP